MWRTAETRFVRHVCLRNPFLLFLFGIPSIYSLPEIGSTSSALWLHHAHPFVAAAKKTSRMQRSRGFGNRVVVSKNCYSIYTDCALMWLLQTKLLASVVWKRGCQPFSWPHSQNGTHCRKEICSTCLFKESIPAFPFWKFQASTPCQKLEVLESGSTFRHLFIMAASCPSLRCSCRNKPVSCREAEGLVVELFSPRFDIHTVIVLSVVVPNDCCKPMNNCWDWAFSNSGLEVWLPAFQLQMRARCDELPKGDLFDMVV